MKNIIYFCFVLLTGSLPQHCPARKVGKGIQAILGQKVVLHSAQVRICENYKLTAGSYVKVQANIEC